MLRCHVRGLRAAAIAEDTGLHRQRVVHALPRVRARRQAQVPPVFHGTVEGDEPSVGSRWRNWRYPRRVRGSTRGRGPRKTPVVGILCRGGQVWAPVVPDLAITTRVPLIGRRVRRGSVVGTDAVRLYPGIAAKGYVPRLGHPDQGEFRSRQGVPSNGVDGFWGDFTRRVAAQGGIRPDRLPLSVAEYGWRDNHRRLSVPQQVTVRMNILRKNYRKSGG